MLTREDIDWLRGEFARCRPWLQAALDRDVGTHNMDDVWAEIEAGTAEFWPCANAALVVRIVQYPRAKVLYGWLAGGDLREIIVAERKIRAHAQEVGVDIVLLIGRSGWARVFPGYKKSHTIVMHRLDKGVAP
jgi:hypothetical protein